MVVAASPPPSPLVPFDPDEAKPRSRVQADILEHRQEQIKAEEMKLKSLQGQVSQAPFVLQLPDFLQPRRMQVSRCTVLARSLCRPCAG